MGTPTQAQESPPPESRPLARLLTMLVVGIAVVFVALGWWRFLFSDSEQRRTAFRSSSQAVPSSPDRPSLTSPVAEKFVIEGPTGGSPSAAEGETIIEIQDQAGAPVDHATIWQVDSDERWVELSSQERLGISNREGRWTSAGAEAPASGTGCVVTKPGFSTASILIARGSHQIVILPRHSGLLFHVKSPSGEPVSGVTITASRLTLPSSTLAPPGGHGLPGLGFGMGALWTCESNGLGEAHIEGAPPGRYQVEIFPSDYLWVSPPEGNVIDSSEGRIEIVVQPLYAALLAVEGARIDTWNSRDHTGFGFDRWMTEGCAVWERRLRERFSEAAVWVGASRKQGRAPSVEFVAYLSDGRSVHDVVESVPLRDLQGPLVVPANEIRSRPVGRLLLKIENVDRSGVDLNGVGLISERSDFRSGFATELESEKEVSLPAGEYLMFVPGFYQAYFAGTRNSIPITVESGKLNQVLLKATTLLVKRRITLGTSTKGGIARGAIEIVASGGTPWRITASGRSASEIWLPAHGATITASAFGFHGESRFVAGDEASPRDVIFELRPEGE